MASDLDGGAKLTSLHKKKMLSPKTSGFLPKFWFKPSQWAGRSSLAGCPFDLNPGQKVRVKAVKATINVPIQHTGVWCNSLQRITFLNLCRILSIKCRKTPFRKPFESTQVHTLSKMPPGGSLCFPACRWKQSREKSDVDGKHSQSFNVPLDRSNMESRTNWCPCICCTDCCIPHFHAVRCTQCAYIESTEGVATGHKTTLRRGKANWDVSQLPLLMSGPIQCKSVNTFRIDG